MIQDGTPGLYANLLRTLSLAPAPPILWVNFQFYFLLKIHWVCFRFTLQNDKQILGRWLSVWGFNMGTWVWIPNTQHLEQGIAVYACKLALRQVELGNSLVSQQTWNNSGSRVSKRLCLKEIRQESDKGKHCMCFCGLHVCVYGHMHLHTHVHASCIPLAPKNTIKGDVKSQRKEAEADGRMVSVYLCFF